MNDSQFVSKFIDKSREVIVFPRTQYSWEEIISGVFVDSPNGPSRRMAAVERNTFRGFHKIDKCGVGSGEVFRSVLTSRKIEILKLLESADSCEDLHRIQNDVREEMISKLTNIKPNMLESYNKVRKPLDLYFEHLVAMSREVAPFREKLVKNLFLPLDSKMFQQQELFSINDLNTAGISRRSTYTNVTSERMYMDLQESAKNRADSLSQLSGKEFLPIYFDFLWNDRYKRWGSNLFETNPY